MTKYEFLGDLSHLLEDLPEEERNQAIKYYEEYFADAGEENEQDVIQELVSPAEIAKQIKESSPDQIFYGEGCASRVNDKITPYTENDNTYTQSDNTYTDHNTSNNGGFATSSQTAPDDNHTLRNVMIVIALIIASPIILSVVSTIFGLLIALISTIFGLFCALVLGGGGVAIGGIACVFGGLIPCFTGTGYRDDDPRTHMWRDLLLL